MKRTILFIALLLSMPPLIADDFGFRFGIKTSPNLSWFRTETRGYENNGVALGFSYGLVADYEFAQNYAIGSGFNIVRTGGTLRYNYIHEGFPTQKRRDYSYRYLEFPLTLKLKTSEVGFITYYGQFGVGLSFNTRARADQRIALGTGSSLRTTDVDISDETRFLKGALIIGGGLEYNFGGRTSLLAGLTFHNGFSNVLSVDNPAVQATPSAVSNYLEMTLGVLF